MNWKLMALIGSVVLAVLALALVVVLHLMGAAHIYVDFYSVEFDGQPTAFVTTFIVVTVGIATYLIFHKPRSTPKS